MFKEIKPAKFAQTSETERSSQFSSDQQELVNLILDVTTETFAEIEVMSKFDPQLVFATQTDSSGKQSYTADLVAEVRFRSSLTKLWKEYLESRLGKLDIVGEESLGAAFNKDGVMCLVDTIDGTDLYVHNIRQWCITFTLFTNSGALAAVVGTPSPAGGVDIFFSVDKARVFFKGANEEIRSVSGGSGEKDLSRATLSYYGQRISTVNLKEYLPGLEAFMEGKENNLKIYGLSGIPIIAKMVYNNGYKKFDIVLQGIGQQIHDAAPALIIAIRSGLVVINLDTFQPFTEDELIEALLIPKQARIRYIVAATKELANQVMQCLDSAPKRVLN